MTLVSIFYAQPSFARDQLVCEEIAREVEKKNKLPKNILTSISLVEAGRRDKDGLIKSWPWSLNHAGKSMFFDTKAKALEYLKKNITPAFKNIDVGCMQINVRWHRKNFDTLEAMINPRKNIEYAALFLSNLKSAHGSWEEAIKHYHSSTPKLNVKYYAKVQKVWSKKTDNESLVQTASLVLNEGIVYPRSGLIRLDYNNFDPYSNVNILKNQMLQLERNDVEMKRYDKEIYLNTNSIQHNEVDEREELKRYIKTKSVYLGEKIDMILLFRDEFSNN
jgi:hypothetical protein